MTGPFDRDADGVLARELHAIQVQAGHEMCPAASYEVDADAVVCGCGVVLGRSKRDPQAQAELAKLTQEVGVDEFAATQQRENELVAFGQGIIDRHAPDVIESSLVLIDPTVPYGPAEVEAHMLDAAARLERGLRFEAALLVARLETESEYKLAFARALRGAQGSDAKAREADALLSCEDLFRRQTLVQQVHEAMKSMTHTLRSVLSGYQSVGKSVTAAYTTVNAQARADERRAR